MIQSVIPCDIYSGGWDNTKSVLRLAPSAEAVDTEERDDILNCNEMRRFWVAWTDKTIRVGEGSEIGQLEFLYYLDSNFHPIFSVGFSTGYTAIGQWVVGDVEGRTVKYSIYIL